MYYLIALFIVGFLIWAGGRETRWGGLGLLWRSAAWMAGVLFVGSLITGLYLWNQDVKTQRELKFDQAITKTQDEFVGGRIKAAYPQYTDIANEELGARTREKKPELYKTYLDEFYEELLLPASEN